MNIIVSHSITLTESEEKDLLQFIDPSMRKDLFIATIEQMLFEAFLLGCNESDETRSHLKLGA